MRYSSTHTRWAGAAGAVALAVALAACGSDDNSAAADDSGGGSGSSSGAVSTRDVANVGTVLVDSGGRTLYFTDEEADGSISCVDACLGFWTPAAPDGDLPSDIDGLDVTTRDDTGDQQLTLDGAPLYTFTQDRAPGQATGDDLTDSFGGTSFTWHAATTDDSGSGSDDSGDSGDTGGGYQNPYSY